MGIKHKGVNRIFLVLLCLWLSVMTLIYIIDLDFNLSEMWKYFDNFIMITFGGALGFIIAMRILVELFNNPLPKLIRWIKDGFENPH